MPITIAALSISLDVRLDILEASNVAEAIMAGGIDALAVGASGPVLGAAVEGVARMSF